MFNIPSLTDWDLVTHICVGNLTIIGSDKGLSPGQPEAINWTNDGLMLIRPFGTNFSEILIFLYVFIHEKHLKMSSGKWQPFYLGPDVLMEEDRHEEYFVLNQCHVVKK